MWRGAQCSLFVQALNLFYAVVVELTVTTCVTVCVTVVVMYQTQNVVVVVASVVDVVCAVVTKVDVRLTWSVLVTSLVK